MIVIFGGTTEGRQLAEFCEEEKIPAIVCVATDFGNESAERKNERR